MAIFHHPVQWAGLWGTAFLACLLFGGTAAGDVVLRGAVVEEGTDRPIPVRLYIHAQADGRWHFARSADPNGAAVTYAREASPRSVEVHTTLSAHPFEADLPPGRYTLTIERGKEYLPLSEEVVVGENDPVRTFRLRRWINMADSGWYSGETHIHRPLDELPLLVLAEDLNAAFPLTHWVRVSHTPPGLVEGAAPVPDDPDRLLIEVDPTHAIHTLNTEYEIFSVRGRDHTLGAVFVLNHRKPLPMGVPPVAPVAREARLQGAMLDLDKHSWHWSLMIVPVMGVDLFELANNHMWRTEFGFPGWTLETLPADWEIETNDRGWTEWGWMDFGFKTYYALLNCGFKMQPSGGTGSGVHPVPLGFGRVYVHLDGDFDLQRWVQGLRAGRSFVTTGPMLLVRFNDQLPGHRFQSKQGQPILCRLTGSAESSHPLERVEVVVNGQVQRVLQPANLPREQGGFRSPIETQVELSGSGWVAVRCFQKDSAGRLRFAHTAPVHFEAQDRPLRPRQREVAYLVRRMEEEIIRCREILEPEALAEFTEALHRFQALEANAIP